MYCNICNMGEQINLEKLLINEDYRLDKNPKPSSLMAGVFEASCTRPCFNWTKPYLQPSNQMLLPSSISPERGDFLSPDLCKRIKPLYDNSIFNDDFILGGSKWTINTDTILPSVTNTYLLPQYQQLGIMEYQSCLLAKSYGIPKMTSAIANISKISGVIDGYNASLRELIAPSSMMEDYNSLAIDIYKSFNKTGVVSTWGLGLIDTATYLVDRHVNWMSGLCDSVWNGGSRSQQSDWEIGSPKINFISQLPIELNKEKIKKPDITIKEATESIPLLDLLEKGKMLIDKIVSINYICERTDRNPIFKYTGAVMKAVATIVGTCCSTKAALGELIDGLYKIFYENLSRVKAYVSDEVVRSEAVFQCVFRVKDIRTDYRHDYEHGTDAEIKKKQKKIGEAYAYYAGKPLLSSREDFQNVQSKLYDEFDSLLDYLQTIL